MAYWRVALRILKYLDTTNHLGLTYRLGNRLTTVSAYVDAGFANGIGCQSRYGYAVFLSGCLISWASKCTTMVCLSTAEAEFIAATEAAKDVIWIRGLLQELSLDSKVASTVYEDNQACVSMINNSAVSPRNRHFAVKMAWLRDQVSNNKIKFVFVQSKKNFADLFTKVLPEDQFRTLREKLMNGV